ncbi:MAG: hypothetical protein ACRDD2_12045 [Sarcina sp.]
MPKALGIPKVTYSLNNQNSNDNSDANENLIDGLKQLPLPSAYGLTSSSPKIQPVASYVEPFLGTWIVKEQIGQNPYEVEGASPIGKTITISQSQFTDNSKSPAVAVTDPYYAIMHIPSYQITQDYPLSVFSQSGLPSGTLSVLTVNPSNEHTPITNPAFNSDALFIVNNNLVVVVGKSFFICNKQ